MFGGDKKFQALKDSLASIGKSSGAGQDKIIPSHDERNVHYNSREIPQKNLPSFKKSSGFREEDFMSSIDKTFRSGLLKQQMKFEYQLKKGGMKASKPGIKESRVTPKFQKSQIDLTKANFFSCMDSTEYARDFELTPKIIRKN